MRYMELGKWKDKITLDDLQYRTKSYKHNFLQYETIRSFGDNIYTGKINLCKAKMEQKNILKNIIDFYDKLRPRTMEGKNKNRYL